MRLGSVDRRWNTGIRYPLTLLLIMGVALLGLQGHRDSAML